METLSASDGSGRTGAGFCLSRYKSPLVIGFGVDAAGSFGVGASSVSVECMVAPSTMIDVDWGHESSISKENSDWGVKL